MGYTALVPFPKAILRMRIAPFVPPHVVSRYQERIEHIEPDAAIRRVHWGCLNGNEIKLEPDGDRHILVEYNRRDGVPIRVVLIVSPSPPSMLLARQSTHYVRTILTMDFYHANITRRTGVGRRKAMKRRHYFDQVPEHKTRRSPTRVLKEELRRREIDKEMRDQ